MVKKNYSLLIASGTIFIVVVGLFSYYYRKTDPVSTNTNTITYDIATDNELVILHLGNPVKAGKVNLTLTLTSHNKTDEAVASTVSVQSDDGSVLGTVEFDHIDDTQTLNGYSLRLISATASAAQVLVLTPATTTSAE